MFSKLKYTRNPQRNRLHAQHLTCCARGFKSSAISEDSIPWWTQAIWDWLRAKKRSEQDCAYTPYLHFQTVYTVRLRYGTVQNRMIRSKWKCGTIPVRYGKPIDRTSLRGHPFWGACPPATRNFRPNNYHYIIYIILIIKEWNKDE